MKDFVKVFLVISVLASVFYWGRHLGESNSKAYKDFVVAESDFQKNRQAQEKLQNIKGSFQSILDKSDFKNASELLTQMMTVLVTDLSIYIKPENARKLQAANVQWNKELAEKNAQDSKEISTDSVIDTLVTNNLTSALEEPQKDKGRDALSENQKLSTDEIKSTGGNFFTEGLSKEALDQEPITVSQLLKEETSRRIAEEKYPFNEKKYKTSEWLIQNSEEEKQIENSLKALELRSLSSILEKAKRASFEETKQLAGSYRGTLKDVLDQGYATLMIDLSESPLNSLVGKISLLREGEVEFEKEFDTEHLGFINHDFSAHFIELSSNKMLQVYKIPSQSKLAGILYERLPNGSTKTIGRFTLINTRF